MATRRRSFESSAERPALTPDSREQQMIALAVNQAEEQLRNGTASSAIVCHYLKLASSETRLKMEKLEEENRLLRAKTQTLEDARNNNELYINAINAMKEYSGHSNEAEDFIP